MKRNDPRIREWENQERLRFLIPLKPGLQGEDPPNLGSIDLDKEGFEHIQEETAILKEVSYDPAGKYGQDFNLVLTFPPNPPDNPFESDQMFFNTVPVDDDDPANAEWGNRMTWKRIHSILEGMGAPEDLEDPDAWTEFVQQKTGSEVKIHLRQSYSVKSGKLYKSIEWMEPA